MTAEKKEIEQLYISHHQRLQAYARLLLKDDDEELENLIEEKYESLFDELKTVKEENKKLHEDIKNWLKTNNPLIKKTVIQFNF
jgi:DNA-directed RNA polymerase specialized sigma24 family protein